MSIEINSTLIELWLLNSILAYSAYIVLTGGAFSFAYVAFIAVGAYTAANLTVKHGHSILWGLVAAPVISAVVALVLAKPLERLSGVYLAIASISVVGIVQVLLVNWTKLTGGPLGIAGIPLVLEPWHLALVVIAIALTVRQLERSNLGRAIRMTRLDPIVAGTMGVDVRRVRLWLFVGSAVLGSWAGVLRAHYFGFVTPDDYGFNLVILLLAMVIIGGVGQLDRPGHRGGDLHAAAGVAARSRRLAGPDDRRAAARHHHLQPRGRRRRHQDLLAQAGRAPAKGHVTGGAGRVRRPGAGRAGATGGDLRRAGLMSMLDLDGVTLNYGALRAVDAVDLELANGEICGLVGPNGSGKSSLLNTISGVSVLTEGKIGLGGEDVTSAPSHRLARLGVARTFQLVRMLNGLTVRENVADGCYAMSRRSGLAHVARSLFSPRRYTGETVEVVDEAMERAGVTRFADEVVGELPFGIQRRVEVARAIATRPKLLLFDEPAAGLSEKDLEDLEQIINDEAARGCTVILVDHHLHFVLRVCPRIVVLNFGKLIFDGTGDDAVADPGVREAYVGS